MPPRKDFRRPNDIDVIELSAAAPCDNEQIRIKRHLPSGDNASATAAAITADNAAAGAVLATNVTAANSAAFGVTLKTRSHNNDKESLTTDFMKEKEKKKVC